MYSSNIVDQYVLPYLDDILVYGQKHLMSYKNTYLKCFHDCEHKSSM